MLYQSTAKHEPVPPTIHLIIAVAFVGFLITGAQTLLIFFKGDAFCLNEGCEIVESLTVVPPLFFNLAGAVYFLIVFRCFAKGRNGARFWLNSGRLLLLSGMAAEGVLVSFQYYVAQVFCSYCLVVFSIICLMTVLAGMRQIFAGLFVFCAVLAAFSSLQFSPAGSSNEIVLDDGSFAKLEGDGRDGNMYLFYSATCVHCEEVIATLDKEFQCPIRFNPVGEVEELAVDGAVRSSGYLPEVNVRYLKNLGIREIPVLAVQKGGETRILRGKTLILDYLDESCRPQPVSDTGLGESSNISGQSSVLSPGSYYGAPAEDESCGVDVDCEDESSLQSSQ